MKLYQYLMVLGLWGTIIACEDEDICIEQPTPRLFIAFNKNPLTPAMDSIIVYRENSQGEFVLIQQSKATTDSVLVPMPVQNQNLARFIIGTRLYDVKKQDTLTVTYDYESKFVSKSCGFGLKFTNTHFSLTNHYFNSFETLQNEITSETAPHIQFNY